MARNSPKIHGSRSHFSRVSGVVLFFNSFSRINYDIGPIRRFELTMKIQLIQKEILERNPIICQIVSVSGRLVSICLSVEW